jgi:hypothetical protein
MKRYRLRLVNRGMKLHSASMYMAVYWQYAVIWHLLLARVFPDGYNRNC